MSFDLPRDIVLPVDTVDVRLDPAPHPFESANLRAIEENWLHEVTINPHLFDGTVALLSELSYRDGRLAGRCHIVRYATFMYWRRNRQTPGAGHAFAHAMLVSSDNALVAIRMGPHTVNAGRVYFAAGSFELEDFRDGVVDVDSNMVREVKEETGIDLAEALPDRRYHILSSRNGTVIFRRYRVALTANAMITRINDFVAGEDEPEIAAPVVIHSENDLPDDLAPHMQPLIEWHFSGAA
jgi:8-oxo-dGTP pyrophosphatase MutT (NUDIX family)